MIRLSDQTNQREREKGKKNSSWHRKWKMPEMATCHIIEVEFRVKLFLFFINFDVK